METRKYLIHYGEIGLKKGNRPYFEARLIRSIYHATRGLGVAAVKRRYGRLLLEQRPDGDPEELERRLARVHGIAHYDPVTVCGWDLDMVRAVLGEWVREGGFATFAVRSRRVNKQYPKTSYELNVELGRFIEERSGARVDLDAPERTFEVLVLNRRIYLFHRRLPGPGGLPVGVSGRVALLLSGGIDSPVAGERLLRRGCSLEFIHFHSAPYTDRSSQDKAVELAGILARHRLETWIHLVPLGALQQAIVVGAPSPYRVILYRRFMLRLAARIARARRIYALATGESIGQVASQTLANIAVLDETQELPVLRPLIAFDKQEIITEARAIGTFDTSIIPDADCCSFLLPPRPVTGARLAEVRDIEATLELGDSMEETLEKTERVAVGS